MAETLQQGEKLGNLLELVYKYKMNREHCLPEDLHGKYAASYKKLKEEIRDLADDYFKKELLQGFIFTNDEAGYAALEAINDFLHDFGYWKIVSRCLFVNYDVDKACRLTDELHDQIKTQIYMPYWQNYGEVKINENRTGNRNFKADDG